MTTTKIIYFRKNIEWLYLSTLGQEGFYMKLGYIECPPFSEFGSPKESNDDNLSNVILNKVCILPNILFNKNSNPVPTPLESSNLQPPPPPPPLPPSIPKNLPNPSKITTIVHNINNSKTFMRKQI